MRFKVELERKNLKHNEDISADDGIVFADNIDKAKEIAIDIYGEAYIIKEITHAA